MTLDETAVQVRSAIQLRIGSQLRNLHAGFQNEPLPNEHVELILKIRRQERERQRRERQHGIRHTVPG
ncbi:MAG TPA: hypothetical protein VLQ65_09860 [Saliniramus sp.]|nr:hypothetical protein [Saliniramus sp.]